MSKYSILAKAVVANAKDPTKAAARRVGCRMP